MVESFTWYECHYQREMELYLSIVCLALALLLALTLKVALYKPGEMPSPMVEASVSKTVMNSCLLIEPACDIVASFPN